MDRRLKILRGAALLLIGAAVFVSCDNEEFNDEPGTQPGTNGGDIEFAIGFAPQTRASTAADFTSAWEDGDEIGVFAVAHGGTLATSSNHIHNAKLTYNKAGGTWTQATALYWPTTGSGVTSLDFYAYYPYDAAATDPTAITFNVLTDQSGDTGGKSNYNLSDLLTAKSDNSGTGWSKNDGAVPLTFSHALAMVQVTVDDRVGAFDINEDITVKLRGVKAGAALNLGGSSGPEVTTGNDAADITMHRVADASGYVYRALVPAQTLAQNTSVFRIICGDMLLNGSALTGDLTMIGGRAETFIQNTPYTALPLIPKGTFTMGSPDTEPNRQPSETQHTVILTKDFYMSKYQITNAQYAAFLNAASVGEDRMAEVKGFAGQQQLFTLSEWWNVKWNGTGWEPVAGRDNHPMMQVTWYGAKAYADWIGGTLPTEAQWEYACRAGTTTAYSFGDDAAALGDYAWYSGNSNYELHAVGLKRPNPWGLYDMHGLMLEWCSDRYGAYGNGPDTDPTGPALGSYRVLRGGYWRSDAQNCRSAYRHSANPDGAGNSLGFRVAFVP